MPGSSSWLTRCGALALALLCLAAPAGLAQPAARPGAPPHPSHPAAASIAPAAGFHLPPDSVTRHQITVGGRALAYTATAGSLPLTDAQGAVTAEIFYVAFIRDGTGAARRPITYAVNGGPGAASAYLDIGAVGPRVLDFGPSGALPPKSLRLVDNPDTWLPFTDLVFIDPVGTGYSEAAGGEEAAAKNFWGVAPDLDALAEIIRLHLTRIGRLASPVYLLGESYGGFRVARLAQRLARDPGIAPAGVVMLSPVLEFGLMSGNSQAILPWALRLPSYAAARMAETGGIKPAALAAVEHFAMTDYLTALAAGPPAGAATDRLYAHLAQLTGLDAQRIARWRGRIPLDAYIADARGNAGEIVSPYDATVAAIDPDPWNAEGHDDPVLDASIAPFTRAFVGYAQGELGFKTDRPYELLNRDVVRRWNWGDGRHGPPGTLGAAVALGRALALEPRLKVMIAHGLTDILTPYMMSRYVVDHLPPREQARIELKLYDGGHMMYLRAGSRHRLFDDARAFYAASPAD